MSHDHASHDSTGTDHSDHVHAMVFHANIHQDILFSGWSTHTVGDLVGACVAIFVASVLYEGFKYLREMIFARGFTNQTASSQVNIVKSECGQNAPCSSQKVVKHSMISSMHFLQTFMHLIQATLSYLLMLVFMTYNVWLCIALILGLGVGYFLFGWQKQTVVDINEHCH